MKNQTDKKIQAMLALLPLKETVKMEAVWKGLWACSPQFAGEVMRHLMICRWVRRVRIGLYRRIV